MPTKKLDTMTRMRRLLLQARDELYETVAEAGDRAREEPALMLRTALIKQIDRTLTDSTGESK